MAFLFIFAESNDVMKELYIDFMEKEPDMLTKKASSNERSRNIPTRIDVSRKYFSKNFT